MKRQSGEELAVKVRRQGIEDLIEADLNIFRYLAEMAEEHLDSLKSARLPDIVQEIRKTLMREIDFTNESRNMLLFSRFFESQELITIPGVFQALTREDVLVMDYMPGVRLDAYQGSQAERERPAWSLARP